MHEQLALRQRLAAREAADAGSDREPVQSGGDAVRSDAMSDLPAIDPNELRERIIDQLRTVFDPEIPVSIWELGLVYDIAIADDGAVEIKMTLTSPHCPVAESLPGEVQRAAASVAGTRDVQVDVVWDPSWNPDMMSEAAKLELGMF